MHRNGSELFPLFPTFSSDNVSKLFFASGISLNRALKRGCFVVVFAQRELPRNLSSSSKASLIISASFFIPGSKAATQQTREGLIYYCGMNKKVRAECAPSEF